MQAGPQGRAGRRRQVAVGHLSARRPPRLLRQSWRGGSSRPTWRGSPPPAPSPSPTRQCGRLQTAPQGISASQGELSVRLEALPGTQAGDWQRYRCVHVHRVCRPCVRVIPTCGVCKDSRVHVCVHGQWVCWCVCLQSAYTFVYTCL